MKTFDYTTRKPIDPSEGCCALKTSPHYYLVPSALLRSHFAISNSSAAAPNSVTLTHSERAQVKNRFRLCTRTLVTKIATFPSPRPHPSCARSSSSGQQPFHCPEHGPHHQDSVQGWVPSVAWRCHCGPRQNSQHQIVQLRFQDSLAGRHKQK